MYNSLCSEIREAWAIDASNGLQIYAWTRDGSLIAAHNMLWVLCLLWGGPITAITPLTCFLWAAMPREP